jgi:alpha-glucosidase
VETGREDVLHFVRPGGWHVLCNFGVEPYPLPDGVVRTSSTSPQTPGVLAGESAVWMTEWPV